MDITFRILVGRSVVVYIDNVTVYSKNRQDHIIYMKQIFERCRKYDISLNPKKSIFAVSEGRLLGHVIFKDGIFVDSERTKAIMHIPMPNSNKYMQSFFGKRNFVRIFVADFA